MRTAKIINEPGRIRDMSTNAILSIDPMLVRRHEKRVADLQNEEMREKDIAQMKSDISDIKNMLRRLSNSSFQN